MCAARFSVEICSLPPGIQMDCFKLSRALMVGIPGCLDIAPDDCNIYTDTNGQQHCCARITPSSFCDFLNRLSEQCGGQLKVTPITRTPEKEWSKAS